MSENLVIGGVIYPNVAGIKATNSNSETETYVKPSGSLSVTENDTYDVTQYASAVVNIPDHLAKYFANQTDNIEYDFYIASIDGQLKGWSNLQTAVFHSVGTVSNRALSGATSLTKLVFVELGSLGYEGLRTIHESSGGTKAVVDLGNCASLGTNALNYANESCFIFRKTDGICTASASNSISSIGASCPAYVPSALLDTYKAASNWSTKADYIFALEGTPYEDPDWWKN